MTAGIHLPEAVKKLVVMNVNIAKISGYSDKDHDEIRAIEESRNTKRQKWLFQQQRTSLDSDVPGRSGGKPPWYCFNRMDGI